MTAVSLRAAAIADRRVERRAAIARRGDRDIALLSSPQASSIVAEWRELARLGGDDNVFFHPGMLLHPVGLGGRLDRHQAGLREAAHLAGARGAARVDGLDGRVVSGRSRRSCAPGENLAKSRRGADQGPPGGGLLYNAGLAAFRAEIEARASARRLRSR